MYTLSGLNEDNAFVPYAQYITLIMGGLVVASVAARAYNSRSIKIGGALVPSRYMTADRPYRMACGLYIAISILVFASIIALYEQVEPFIKFVAETAFGSQNYEKLQKLLGEKGPTFFSTIVVSAVAMTGAFYLEKEYNPAIFIRDWIQSWAAIPTRVRRVVDSINTSLEVPPSFVSGGTYSEYLVSPADFEKSRNTIERRWAECVYMRQWLDRKEARGQCAFFFAEQCFRWSEVKSGFSDVRAKLNNIRAMARMASDINTVISEFGAVSNDLEKLHGSIATLAACYMAYNEPNEHFFTQEALRFGVNVKTKDRINPLEYIIVFIVGVSLATYYSVLTGAHLYDLYVFYNYGKESIHIEPTPTPFDAFVLTKWVLYGCAAWVAPVAMILCAMYAGWRIRKSGPNSYLITYCWVLLCAFIVSDVSLSLSVQFLDGKLVEGVGTFELFFPIRELVPRTGHHVGAHRALSESPN